MRKSTELQRVIIEVTNRCNLNCRICLRRSWQSPPGSMVPAVFAQFITGLQEYSSPPDVFFGGYGEPLSHPDCLEMVRHTSAAGSRTALITNGTLLTPQLLESLVNNGLTKLWISLDSYHRDAVRETSSLTISPNILDLFSDLSRHNNRLIDALDPGLALILSRDNQAELLDLIERGRRSGINSYFITHLEAYQASLADDVPEPITNLRHLGTNQLAYSDFIQFLKALSTNDPELSIAGPVTNPRNTCPFVNRGDLVLRWDGEVCPCLPLLYDRSIQIGSWEHRQIAYSLGNISDHSLKEIWSDQGYIRLRERVLEKDFSPCLSCRDCWLSEDNLQDCMGFDHPACGGCLWGAGLISCP